MLDRLDSPKKKVSMNNFSENKKKNKIKKIRGFCKINGLESNRSNVNVVMLIAF